MGLENLLSEVKQAEKKAGVDFTSGEPNLYLDDDLLGYMIASSGENRRRHSSCTYFSCNRIIPISK
jgi:hypothetical protein